MVPERLPSSRYSVVDVVAEDLIGRAALEDDDDDDGFVALLVAVCGRDDFDTEVTLEVECRGEKCFSFE